MKHGHLIWTIPGLVFFLYFCIPGLAQSRQVSGIILDKNNIPVIGAAVIIKGTNTGTTTDVDGTFALELPEQGTLVISCLGYSTKEIKITGTAKYNIVLYEDNNLLDEIVVIGYGSMKKKDLTGAIAQIRPDNIAIENPRTIQDVLRGTPGLNVGFDASAKGGGSLQVRGQRSVYTASNHNSPLLVLDGMPFMGELSEINPDDIAQIDILKDASSAAIYGAKAANGVIIITTKQGTKGKPVINISMNFGLSQMTANRDRWNPDEYLQHLQDWRTQSTYGINPETGVWEAYQATAYASQPGFFCNPGNLPPDISLDEWREYSVNDPDESDLSIWARRLGLKGNLLENYLNGKTVDWEDKAFRLGFNQDYNASISGAGDNVNYYFSMGYLNNQGVRKNDSYQAIRASMKLKMSVTKWLEIGANVNFQNRSDGNKDMQLGSILSNSPYADYADENGNPIQYPLDDNYSRRGYNYDFQKQFQELERGYTIINNIFNVKVKLPFNITYTFNASPRFQFFYDREFLSADLPDSAPEDRGVNREQSKRFDWSINNTINWDYTFKDKHHVNITLVQEAEARQFWQDRIEARNILPSDALGFHNTQNGTKENSSFFSSDTYETADALLARVFYSYADTYMLTASVRRDGYSAFGSSNPYATFPSAAVAWTFTNENFFKWQDIMNFGKLRLSYGKNGNRSLSSPYLALANLSAGGGKMHGYLDMSNKEVLYKYLMIDRMANPNLQWEKTSSWNIGLDFGFINNRISGSIEYYRMQTKDMIMTRRLPEFTGFSNITTNLGQVDNNGIELMIQSVNMDRKNFRWTTSFALSYNKNQIKHLYYDYVDGVEQDDETNGWFIGQPISAIWDYKVIGIWQKDEVEEAAKYGQVPGDPKVANIYTEDDIEGPNGAVTPVYNNKDKVILGQTTPPVHWSLRNEFTLWRDLTFSFNLYSYMGHKSMSTNYLNADDKDGRLSNGMENIPKKEYWTVDNPTNEYARIEAVGPVGAVTPGKIYDRSFIRLENLSVAYQLPQKWASAINFDKIKVFGTVRNVAAWAFDWEYGDPETGDWAARTFTFGVNVTF